MSEERGARFEVRGSRFDALVDATVREMLDVEPRLDLRARVLARLEAGSGRLGAGRWKLAAGSVIAAAAMLLVALWLPMLRHDIPSQTIVGVRPVESAVMQPRKGRPTPESADVQDTRVPPRRGSHPSERLPIVTASRGDASAASIAPLEIAPIRVPSMSTSSIAPKEIVIEPLAPIADVEIAPLNPPDRRN